MSDTRRTRDDKSLMHVLGQQLSAAVEDGVPTSRHFSGSLSGHHTRVDVGDAVEVTVDLRDVILDDISALIERSFDLEVTEWLLQHVAAPSSSRTH